jgi:O6-methylguanine-DNA--protein-cysteine methyltransferase
MISFTEKVLKVVQQIPRGRVLTYKEVAVRAGRPRAWRAVGNVLNRYDSKKYSPKGGAASGGKIPCHRVIRSDGRLGGYRWGRKRKAKLLKQEGFYII